MNNELLKRIEERIDFWKEGEPSTSPIVQLLRDCRAEIERKATYVLMTAAEPVEPVAWQYRVVFRLTGEDSFRHGRWHECRDKAEYDDYKSRHWFEVRELYTTPPSVDALIAEIDGLCGDNCGKEMIIYPYELKAILDKYRGQK